MATLMFVEDDPLIRHNLAIVLTAAGHHVLTAGNAADAYRTALAEDFDLLLLDIGLPDESGIDLARRLRKAGKTAPIIFLTAYDSEELIQSSIDCHAHSYLIKPVSAKQLLPVIVTALASNRYHHTQKQKLLAALDGNRETSIAIGILAERLQCSPNDAFEEFRRQARNRQIKMDLLAQEIIKTKK